LKRNDWIISQKWHDVLFIHHKISSELLQPLCPFPLDLYNGQAIISIVPFRMSGIRFPYLPAFPGLSSLWELNLRTYVEINGVKGVYFFTLDTDSLLGEFIARKFFHLPYNHSQILAKVTESSYNFTHQRGNYKLDLSASIGGKKGSSSFDLWATERYSLFTFDRDHIFEGRVHHRPWDLKEIEIKKLDDGFSTLLGDMSLGTPESVSYAQSLEVRFSPFKKIGNHVANTIF
jgi:uncharacterized protein YqjF (DUF2071 family)